jgi:hypothetical protein
VEYFLVAIPHMALTITRRDQAERFLQQVVTKGRYSKKYSFVFIRMDTGIDTGVASTPDVTGGTRYRRYRYRYGIHPEKYRYRRRKQP